MSKTKWTPDSATRVCYLYHGGESSMLYALASCGELRTGDEAFRRGRTDSQWLAELMTELVGELASALVLAEAENDDEADQISALLEELTSAIAKAS